MVLVESIVVDIRVFDFPLFDWWGMVSLISCENSSSWFKPLMPETLYMCKRTKFNKHRPLLVVVQVAYYAGDTRTHGI